MTFRPAIPQLWSINERPVVVGDDAPPIRWVSHRPSCGHRVPALVGPLPVARYIDPTAPPGIEDVRFAVVDAMPGECPSCDDVPRMAVRDAEADR